MLGLLSLAQLPRRLTLDFRDFFSKGFAFNQIDGTVRFGDGKARSDKLVIDGPAATIDIRGAANLRAQSFDQTIEVRPKAGNLLTAIGAVAGGPVGAAIGAAANVVLQQAAGLAGGQDLPRDRAMEGTQGRGDGTRAEPGDRGPGGPPPR